MRRHTVVVLLAVAAATMLLFSPAIDGQFLDWDDDRNFVHNPHYRGLGWDNIRWMLTSTLMGHWIPVTWLTLGLDYVLWGMEPAGYHLTNLGLHALNAALFFLVVHRLLAAALPAAGTLALAVGAAAAALFWALHPLRVESVAWITERRDVVSGAFYLLTVLTYLSAAGHTGRARAWRVAASVLAYALALMSKSIVMTLPIVLVVLDVYPLRRLPGSWRAWWTPQARRIWLEKAPYAALAAAAAVTALVVVAGTVPLTPTDTMPYAARPLVFLYDLAFYMWKTVVPTGLAAIYEMPRSLGVMWPALVAGAATSVGLTLAFVAWRQRFPAVLAVWIAYVVSVAPTGGLVHNGPQIAADRYTYLACLGWAALGGGVVAALAVRRRLVSRVALAGVAVWLTVLTVLTWRQIAVWRSTETLFAHATAIDPECARCHVELGAALGRRGDIDRGLGHFRTAVRLRPERIIYRANVGLLLLRAGRPAEAVDEFRAVVDAYPRHLHVLTNLGLSLLAMGRPADAAASLERATTVDPGFAPAHVGLVHAYRALGRSDDVVRHAAVLERLNPHRGADSAR